MLKGRQQEGRGFTGSGLRLTGDILAPERQRQRLVLYRRAVDKASIFQAFYDGIRKFQVAEACFGQM